MDKIKRKRGVKNNMEQLKKKTLWKSVTSIDILSKSSMMFECSHACVKCGPALTMWIYPIWWSSSSSLFYHSIQFSYSFATFLLFASCSCCFVCFLTTMVTTLYISMEHHSISHTYTSLIQRSNLLKEKLEFGVALSQLYAACVCLLEDFFVTLLFAIGFCVRFLFYITGTTFFAVKSRPMLSSSSSLLSLSLRETHRWNGFSLFDARTRLCTHVRFVTFISCVCVSNEIIFHSLQFDALLCAFRPFSENLFFWRRKRPYCFSHHSFLPLAFFYFGYFFASPYD